MDKWIAVCPKCERIYQMPEYMPDWYCAHLPEKLEIVTDSIPSMEVPFEKVLCKILKARHDPPLR